MVGLIGFDDDDENDLPVLDREGGFGFVVLDEAPGWEAMDDVEALR